MGPFRRFDTCSLTRTSFELSSGRRRRRLLALVVALGAAGGLVAGGLQYFERQMAPARQVAALERENARLRQAGEEARMALETERATRVELERQVSELGQRVHKLRAELGFLRAESDK